MVGRGDWGVPSSTFSVPPFAGPGQPQWLVGPDIPPLLISLIQDRLSASNTVIMTQQWVADSIDEFFECLAIDTGGSGDYSIVRGTLGTTIANSTVDSVWRLNRSDLTINEVVLAPNYKTIGSTSGDPFQVRVRNPHRSSGYGGLVVGGDGVTGRSPAIALYDSTSGAFSVFMELGLILGTDGTLHNLYRVNDVAGIASPEIGRGMRYFQAATGADIAVTTSNTPIFSTTFTFKNGRAYRMEWGAAIFLSASTNVMEFDVYINGAQKAGGAYGPSGAGFGISACGSRFFTNSSGADHTYTVVLNALTNTGTGTVLGTPANNNSRHFLIEDVGAAGDFPGCIPIT